ncbi:MAG: polysaccharide biosynthesis/export family protein [Acidobacteria bacterium]|nr:polysaccharide biosynthesis/export family protein [Acidobacteriota bacterium]
MKTMHAILRAAVLSSLLSLTFVGAHAQFSGPVDIVDTGVNHPADLTTDQSILFPPNREIRLAPGDLISIHIFGATDYNPQDRVSLDGYIRIPLIGPVQVEGLSTHEAEHLIASRLETAGMYRNPQVTIVIMEGPSHVATLAGELHGTVPLLTPRRLLDVIATGGGFPGTATHIVTIQRPGLNKPIVVDLGNDPTKSNLSNIPIFPGDTIIVGRTGVVYLVGAVKNQTPLPLSKASPLTLLQAISSSGGTTFEAKTKDVKIIRTIGTKRTMINVDYRRVEEGKAPDPILFADDIVLVPSNAVKAAIRAGGIGTALAIASLLAFTIVR